MSKINFFDKFAKMSISNGKGTSTNSDVNCQGSINNVTQKINDLSLKVKENEVSESVEVPFKHSSSIILTKGQYKSYSGFVYEFYPSRLYIEIMDIIYVPKRVYGDKNIGDKVDVYSTIVDKIDEMYGIIIKNDSKVGDSRDTEEELRIIKNYCMHIVFIVINNLKKIAIFVNNNELKILELGDIESEYEIMVKLSNIVKENRISDIKYYKKDIVGDELKYDEYIMIIDSGKFGKLSRIIEEQYVLESKKNTYIMKNMVELKDKNTVYIKKGIYKDKIGKILKSEEASFKLNIEPLGLMIYSHIVKSGDYYVDKKITKDDIFYKDLLLTDNTYFQILKIKGETLYGKVLNNNVFSERIIKKSDIKMFMPGCSIDTLSTRVGDGICNVKYKTECEPLLNDNNKMNDVEFVESENENNDYQDEEDIPDQCDYEYDLNDNNYDNEKDQKENLIQSETNIEMKKSFKDLERVDYFTVKLKKTEKDIMKNAIKILEILGYSSDIINIYDLINNVTSIKKLIDSELSLLNINEWKDTDLKYIIMIVLCYEIMKVGFSITKATFNTYVAKLINKKYFMKSQISGSLFLRDIEDIEDTEINNKLKFMNLIKMSCDEKNKLNQMYKGGDYSGVINIMLHNCSLILKEIFNEIVFVDETYKIEYIPVCKPKTIKQYPKYFMTSNEIALGLDIPETANKIIWNPETIKIMKRLKSALSLKYKDENNDTLKIVYKFVIDNIENAPFVLRNNCNSLNSIDKLKYKELKRTFDMFTSKIGILLSEKNKIRELNIKCIKEEKENLTQKRKQFIDNKSLEEIELSMKNMMEKNTNMLKRIKL